VTQPSPKPRRPASGFGAPRKKREPKPEPEFPPDARISALHPTQRDPTRLTVKVNGRSVGTLSTKLVDDLGLAVGDVWTEHLRTTLRGALKYDKAFRAATSRLARRPMSRGQIERKLRDLDHEAEVIAQVLERLDQLELIDDQKFGEIVVRETMRAKPAGPRLLRQKLMQKGVDRALIDGLVDEATSDDDQQAESAKELVRKKLPSLQRVDAATRQRRVYGLLARRGFTGDAVRAAMELLKGDEEETFD